jgi:hypothetical protein
VEAGRRGPRGRGAVHATHFADTTHDHMDSGKSATALQTVGSYGGLGLAVTAGWRRRHGLADVNPTRCPWCSTTDQIVVQDEQHVFFSCRHFQNLRAQKPLLFATDRESSLWRIFNEYKVTYEDIAWFLKETKLMYTMR